MVKLLLAGSLLIFAGACQTLPTAGPAQEQRLFQASMDEVFAEVTTLLLRKGYRIVVHESTKGRIEALSPLRAGGLGETTQYRLRVGFTEEDRERIAVSLRATILEESEVPVHGRATFERPLRDPLFVDGFFDELATRLE